MISVRIGELRRITVERYAYLNCLCLGVVCCLFQEWFFSTGDVYIVMRNICNDWC